MLGIKRWTTAVLILVVLMTILAPAVSAQAPKKPVFYVVSHGGPGDPFWTVVIRGVNDAAKVLDVEAHYASPTVYSVTELTNLLNTAIAAKPDGIAATITNVQAVDEPLRRAISAGIPVIAINVADPRPEGQRIPYLFYIGAMGYDGGLQGGQYMLTTAQAQGKKITRAVCAIQEPGHVDLEARCQGFKDALKGITVDELDITNNPTQAVDIIKAYFAKNPDANAILTLGPLGTIPAVQWLKESGNVGKIFHGTFDLSTDTLNAIRDGTTLFTIDQQQYMQGYLPIVFLNLYHNYLLKPASDIKTGPFFVTKDNVEAIAKLIQEGYR
jgi:simple sugar transport system substrate-binding protein